MKHCCVVQNETRCFFIIESKEFYMPVKLSEREDEYSALKEFKQMKRPEEAIAIAIAVKKRKNAMMAIALAMLLSVAWFVESADARSRSGGRSFKRSSSYSKPASKPRQSNEVRKNSSGSRFGGGSGAFTRGLAGGMMGGVLGSMLFGGTANAMGAGGFGGSGIGLFEIILIGGVCYFIYRRFSRQRATSQGVDSGHNLFGSSMNQFKEGASGGTELNNTPIDDPLVSGMNEIWAVDDTFQPEAFKETAQDLFFKIQAGWIHRDIDPMKDLIGGQLLTEYARHFEEMKQKKHINRLENIAVRKVELMDAGVEGDEIFVVMQFTANLLDYTVDERSGDVVSGDSENPIKFQEKWAFTRPASGGRWKLEGIEV